MLNKYDFIIVGAGLSGAVIAESLANINKTCLVVDVRDHVGGNCYDYIDELGIRVNKYGAHIFHTDYEDVWEYINRFSEWTRWDHKVLACVDGNYVPVPVNINTINVVCCQHIATTSEAEEWLKNERQTFDTIENSEQVSLSRVGPRLYEKLFKPYTFKQWAKYPAELDASVMARIPVRSDHDDRYFTDKYQALPTNGYTPFIQRILTHPNITVKLSTSFEDVIDEVEYNQIVYTGPIDKYFSNSGFPALEYRSIKFITEHYRNTRFYQPCSVVNYPTDIIPFTRIVEYKHFLNQKSEHTTIVKEVTTDEGEPFYPVPNQKNIALYEQYQILAGKNTNVHFIGRLATYKYINMDQAIKNALDYFHTHFTDS